MKTETYLLIIAILAILVMGAVLATAVLYPNGVASLGGRSNYITVSAQGFAYGYPTQAILYLSLNGSGPTASIATTNASLTLQRLNYSVKGYVNGNLSLIKTLSYSLFKVRNSTQYEVVESLKVTIPNINNASAALGNLSSINNVYVNSVSPVLSNSQIKAMIGEALSDALANATAQAKVLANNATVTTHNISVSSYYVFPSFNSGAALPSGAQASLFYSGQNQVSESITASFSYK